MFYVNYISINMGWEIIALEVHFEIITETSFPPTPLTLDCPHPQPTRVKWLMVGGGGVTQTLMCKE